ncbi:hypothetical protein [Cytobacillus purgationiresistens]|uniref:Uncharacterized protein n=1 Tax=Cytobacillus purgationiresistens TaxID=863449 RepID=A0ABU0AI90_9BACI|nr:hypothetical protein [Cytobacillus purgationiresistens]MDQ0270973.1 hypothetical protein [Cytobacillus purgationiresistens]
MKKQNELNLKMEFEQKVKNQESKLNKESDESEKVIIKIPDGSKKKGNHLSVER